MPHSASSTMMCSKVRPKSVISYSTVMGFVCFTLLVIRRFISKSCNSFDSIFAPMPVTSRFKSLKRIFPKTISADRIWNFHLPESILMASFIPTILRLHWLGFRTFFSSFKMRNLLLIKVTNFRYGFLQHTSFLLETNSINRK
ncbi:Uncharacterised protein [Empedobacter falsenii]|uniref:Uncharacterized protein n=1 Tax=Empedobacter falsenii TaxID=343874 RepID=A0A376GHS0_9FLAO|nr:Uncharacterised protein [Empedobacter falsenii]